jgi:ribonuclease HIII
MAIHKELKLSPPLQGQRKEALISWLKNPQVKAEQNCVYRLDGISPQSKEKILVKQYRNGTFTLQTQSDATLQEALVVLGILSPTAHTLTPLEVYYPCGADESGKGDYFGALVTACVHVEEAKLPRLQALGITDSKAMTDAKIQAVAPQLVEALGIENVAFLVLMPEGYNRQYEALKLQGKHLNHLLALMHAKTVAGLLQKQTLETPPALMVDQFTQGSHLLDAMRQFAPSVKVAQSTKAELAHPAVAAASVIARYKFLESMATLRERSGFDLPLGASAKVVSMGKRIYQSGGMPVLSQVAKLHFKTTLEVTS